MSAPLLTDEQMRVLKRQIDMAPKRWPFALANELEYARAIESAVRAPLLAEIERLTAELAEARKALKLVQQHHATAWNRGHTMGMAANRDIARQAQEAVARDAWGNAQLTEALLAAEAERDAARAELEAEKTADGLREPMNGTDWHVQWWNESARVMLPAGSRINNITPFRNGTLILTIKRAARSAT